MTDSHIVFRVGFRDSPLSRIQAANGLGRIGRLVPALAFETVALSSPGDRDRALDLRESPPDFFTRDLDDAVLRGDLDGALHSAKDVAYPIADGLDWCWLPWREDPRDALVLAPGRRVEHLPANPVVGTSSERRDAYARRRFPGARLTPIRGNIEARLAQLDAGDVDVLLMAGAALRRLGLASRITEWIDLDELHSPDGQGSLALTFRADDRRLLRLRSLFVPAVTFVGAGVGSADTCTRGGLAALRRAQVCLHDVLLSHELLGFLPPDCEAIDVGKRCGEHRRSQGETTALLLDRARRGKRVVRLKGGDATLYARLAEEVEALDRLRLPYRVCPGVSSLGVASAETGILLTRRGVSPGYCVMSPREAGGGLGDVSAAARAALPVVFFMGTKVFDQVAARLVEDGMDARTPTAAVFGSGTEEEFVVRDTLHGMATRLAALHTELPGLVLVGAATGYGFHREWGALRGLRVLLTCSEALQEQGCQLVRDYGGRPICRPLIRLVPDERATASLLERIGTRDWLVVTSPSAVRCLEAVRRKRGVDLRTIPNIASCGPGTTRELLALGLVPAVAPEASFGSEGMVAALRARLQPSDRIARIRSDVAGPALADELRKTGCDVEDCITYRNEAVRHDSLPDFDAVVFASSSAVACFCETWPGGLTGKRVCAMGDPTGNALEQRGVQADCQGASATLKAAIEALAGRCIQEAIDRRSLRHACEEV